MDEPIFTKTNQQLALENERLKAEVERLRNALAFVAEFSKTQEQSRICAERVLASGE